MIRKTIVVKTFFNGKHCWRSAPEEVSFLRIMHDHTFFIEVEIDVNHNQRELEFFIFKREIDKFIEKEFSYKEFEYSCETIAEMIIDFIKTKYSKRNINIFVSEDGINGGKVYYEYK